MNKALQCATQQCCFDVSRPG